MASVKGRRKQRKATHSIIDNSLHFGGRKKRQPYTSQQRKLLHEMYFKDKHPPPEAKKELSRVANIDLKRIDEWLWNARRRIPHPSDTGCTGGSILISGDSNVPTASSSSLPECQNAAPLSKKLPATVARKPASTTNNLSKLHKPSSSFGTIKAPRTISEKPLFQTTVAGTSARNKAHIANFFTDSDETKQSDLSLLSSNVVGSDLSQILVMKKSVLDESAPSEFHGKVSDNSACKGLITNESSIGFLNSMECRETAFSLKQDSSKDKINYAEDTLIGSVCQFPPNVTTIALQSHYTNLYTETSPGSSYYDPLVINPPPEPPQDLFDISPPHPPTSPESISITPAPTPPPCLAPIVSTSVGCLISASAVREHSSSLALPSSSLTSQCLKLASTKKKNTSSSAIHTLEPSSTELTPNTSSPSSSSSSFPPSPAMVNLLVPQNQSATENIAWNSDLETGSEKNKNI